MGFQIEWSCIQQEVEILFAFNNNCWVSVLVAIVVRIWWSQNQGFMIASTSWRILCWILPITFRRISIESLFNWRCCRQVHMVESSFCVAHFVNLEVLFPTADRHRHSYIYSVFDSQETQAQVKTNKQSGTEKTRAYCWQSLYCWFFVAFFSEIIASTSHVYGLS